MIVGRTTRPISDYIDRHAFLVNPTNLEGVMGAGIAKWFKDSFPVMAHMYDLFCKKRNFRAGDVFIWSTPTVNIVNLPTKFTWRSKSNGALIQAGLTALDLYLQYREPRGIVVMPRIGAGLGRLNWETDVMPMVERCAFDCVVATGYMDTPLTVGSDELFATYLVASIEKAGRDYFEHRHDQFLDASRYGIDSTGARVA